MIKYAFSLILRHKLRTVLTSLGITVAVVLLSFIIFGMQDLRNLFVNEFSSRFSPNLVVVTKGGFGFGVFGGGEPEEGAPVEESIISPQVVSEISEMASVEVVMPGVLVTGMQLQIAGEEKKFDQAFIFGADIKGSDSMFKGYEGAETLAKGEAFISKIVLDFYGLKVEDVLGKEITTEISSAALFSSKSKSQLNNKFTFTIVGVVDTGGDRSDLVLGLDDSIDLLVTNGGFVDSNDFLTNIGYDQLYVTVEEGKATEFKDKVKEQYGLTSITSDDVLSFLDLITVGITVILIVFGTVSAIVASIGIINTMVMSVYEQTREIGINKAVGASSRQILLIFLIQSGTIGFVGGLSGLLIVFLGMTLSDGLVVDKLAGIGFTVDQFFHYDLLTASIIAILSIIVGVLAGIYPALMAARLDPVKALRYE